jgi:hypothetical protein
MKTDPVSAAHIYRQALEFIANTKGYREAKDTARQALQVTFERPSNQTNIFTYSGFGAQSNLPHVTITVADPLVQMDTQTARTLALRILEAADAAESDGFIFAFMRDKIGIEPGHIGSMLVQFREYRDALRGEEGEATPNG